MGTWEDEQVVEELSPVGVSEGNGRHPGNTDISIAELIKEEYKKVSDSNSVHIAIPGYDKIRLTAKYRLPEKGSELDKIGREIEREFKNKSAYIKNLMIGIDTMIYLNEGLYVQPIGTAEPVLFDPEETGTGVDYGSLAGYLEWGNMGTRDAIKKLFGGEEREAGILDHAERLNRWLRNASADVTQEFWMQSGE